jgi:hypothetical protein
LFDPESTDCVALGVMNLASAAQYTSMLSVESGLKPRTSDVPPRAEPNRVALTGGTVELRKANGARLDIAGLANPYPIVGAGTVPPGGRGAMSVTLIPKEYADRLRENVLGSDPLAQILVVIKVRGVTDGDLEVESNEWSWPVRLDYRSPIETDNVCASIDFCPSLRGIDGFASACTCPEPADGCML